MRCCCWWDVRMVYAVLVWIFVWIKWLWMLCCFWEQYRNRMRMLWRTKHIIYLNDGASSILCSRRHCCGSLPRAVYFRLSGPSTPAWVIRSPMLFSRSSIRFPISSIRVMIWSDIDWNLSWTFCKRFCTCLEENQLYYLSNIRVLIISINKTRLSHKGSAPACSSDQRCCSGNSSARRRYQSVPA